MKTIDCVFERMIEENVEDVGDIIEAAADHPGPMAITTGTLVVAFIVFPLPFALLGLSRATASAARGIKEGQRQRQQQQQTA